MVLPTETIKAYFVQMLCHRILLLVLISCYRNEQLRSINHKRPQLLICTLCCSIKGVVMFETFRELK